MGETIIEIEKKFIISGLPKGIEPEKDEEIEQVYIRIEPKEEERVRKKTNKKTGEEKYTHTIKRDTENKGALTREETEKEINKETYQELKKQGIKSLKKIRKTYKNKKGEEVIVDKYPEGLYLLEIEYASEEEIGDVCDIIEGVQIHAEVTYSKEYKNQNLAK